MSKSTAITGACGEHYVAAFLSALGLVVALPRGGAPSCDMLVTTQAAGRSISLQVKTATAPVNARTKETKYYAWSVSEKALTCVDSMLWYAFVNIEGWPEDGGCNVPLSVMKIKAVCPAYA